MIVCAASQMKGSGHMLRKTTRSHKRRHHVTSEERRTVDDDDVTTHARAPTETNWFEDITAWYAIHKTPARRRRRRPKTAQTRESEGGFLFGNEWRTLWNERLAWTSEWAWVFEKRSFWCSCRRKPLERLTLASGPAKISQNWKYDRSTKN